MRGRKRKYPTNYPLPPLINSSEEDADDVDLGEAREQHGGHHGDVIDAPDIEVPAADHVHHEAHRNHGVNMGDDIVSDEHSGDDEGVDNDGDIHPLEDENNFPNFFHNNNDDDDQGNFVNID